MNKRAIRETWEKRVRAWQRSGVTAREFAARNGGFNPKTLKFWKWKFGRAAKAPSRREEKPAAVKFVELPVVEAARAPAKAPDAEFVIEIERGSCRLHIDKAFDAQALTRLLAVLEARR